MMRPLKSWIAALALGLPMLALAQAAPAPAPAGDAPKAAPPAGFVAPAEPKPDENNAQRSKSQPGNNAPFWRGVRESGTQPGYTSLPGAEMGTLIQPFVQYPGSAYTSAGEAWRQVRNRWIIPYGGALLLIVLGGLALLYFGKGPIATQGRETGYKIERFTPFERSAHWANAIAFVALAVSGAIMAFGQFFLQPVLGLTLFGWLAYVLKNIHNFMGPLFAVSLVIVFVTFVRDNLPTRADLQWVLKAGGLFSKTELPSHRFNAGEKAVFWGGVFLLGLLVVGSGLVLDKLVPGLVYERGTMQIAHMVHGVATVLMMAMFLGHIYMGTIGMRGAYTAMRTGYVDETWAKEHHAYWYEDIVDGKIPAQRSQPSGPDASGDVRPA
jgi:formate dehydrogenase subunit gamma